MVQGLRFCASTAEGMSSISGWGTQIPHTAHTHKKQENTLKSIMLSLFTSKLMSVEELMLLNCDVAEDS